MSNPKPIAGGHALVGETPSLESSRLTDRTPFSIEAQVVSVNNRSSIDALLSALNAAEWLLSRAKTIDTLMKQIAVDWIETNGSFVVGDVQHSVGYSTTVKCQNVLQTSQTMLGVLEVDFDRFVSLLVSQPFKHGTVRSFISPAEYGRLFKTSRSGKLVNGVPERVLKRLDQRFATINRGDDGCRSSQRRSAHRSDQSQSRGSSESSR